MASLNGGHAAGPVWLRIAALLRERIQTGQVGVGQKLSTQTDLSRQFGVSPAVAGAALSQLASEGLVERRRGAGSFVTRPDRLVLYSSAQGLELEDGTPGRWEHGEPVEEPASAAVANRLGVEAGRPVQRAQSSFVAGLETLCVTDQWWWVGAQVRDSDGVRRVAETISCRPLTVTEADRLGARWMGMVLAIERTVYCDDYPISTGDLVLPAARAQVDVESIFSGPSRLEFEVPIHAATVSDIPGGH